MPEKKKGSRVIGYRRLTAVQTPMPDMTPNVAMPAAQPTTCRGPDGLSASVYEAWAEACGIMAPTVAIKTMPRNMLASLEFMVRNGSSKNLKRYRFLCVSNLF